MNINCLFSARSSPVHINMSSAFRGRNSLVPRPHPSAREKGLVTIARFLVCADLSCDNIHAYNIIII